MRPHFKQVSRDAGDGAGDPKKIHGISELALLGREGHPLIRFQCDTTSHANDGLPRLCSGSKVPRYVYKASFAFIGDLRYV